MKMMKINRNAIDVGRRNFPRSAISNCIGAKYTYVFSPANEQRKRTENLTNEMKSILSWLVPMVSARHTAHDQIHFRNSHKHTLKYSHFGVLATVALYHFLLICIQNSEFRSFSSIFHESKKCFFFFDPNYPQIIMHFHLMGEEKKFSFNT